jgi:hypothetical protein
MSNVASRDAGTHMIDRQARNELAESIRALVSGQVSNDEFEERVPFRRTGDPALAEIFSKGAWCLYSDLSEYRLSGKHRLSAQAKSEVARWILFLKSDFPYEWPRPGFGKMLGLLIANAVTLGVANAFYARRFRACGDAEVWPFLRRADYETALEQPVYLAGQASRATAPLDSQGDHRGKASGLLD